MNVQKKLKYACVHDYEIEKTVMDISIRYNKGRDSTGLCDYKNLNSTRLNDYKTWHELGQFRNRNFFLWDSDSDFFLWDSDAPN